MEKENQKAANEFAINNGYDNALFYDKSDDEVYYIAQNSTSVDAIVGYPIFIVVSDDKISFANPDKTLKILGINPQPDDYEEEINPTKE